MKLEDRVPDAEMYLDDEVERIFNERYLAYLAGPPPFIRLQGEGFLNEPSEQFQVPSCRNAQARPAVY